jgi:hypothetical protein
VHSNTLVSLRYVWMDHMFVGKIEGECEINLYQKVSIDVVGNKMTACFKIMFRLRGLVNTTLPLTTIKLMRESKWVVRLIETSLTPYTKSSPSGLGVGARQPQKMG